MMILRHLPFSFSLFSPFLLILSVHSAVAQDEFSCSNVEVNGVKFDLTSLAQENTFNQTRSRPPTTMVDVYTFNLCENLKKKEEVKDEDQCPEKTRACRIELNQRSDEPERIISVAQIAKSTSAEVTPQLLSSPASGISLVLRGSPFPPSGEEGSTTQVLNLTVLCDKSGVAPELKSYDGTTLNVEWKAPAGCAISGEDRGKDEPESEHAGSGIGWFFLVILLAFVAYLGLGAYYNYSTYGASGFDLIPHRDFWKEVPYMLRDVVAHLCSSVTSRRSSARTGYISV